ncbi:MAG: hypothetical protein ACYC8V_07480 [Caulobacteraceae bacterium]
MAASVDDNHVYVVSATTPAISEPKFIVQVDGIYYVTLALWKYHESEAKTEQQRKDCAEIASLFRSSKKIEAVLLGRTAHFGGGHTSPPPQHLDRG